MNTNAKVYTTEEITKLKEMCSNGETLGNIASVLGRTEGSIRSKCRKLDISFQKERVYWTKEEQKQFENDWEDPSISYVLLRKKYKNRSIIALRSMARRMNLGSRRRSEEYLTIKDIMEEMNVSKDRVIGWTKKGLKYRKSKIKPYKYLIDENDLLVFLESHQSLFDASTISEYLFLKEPQWLKEKRKSDKKNYNHTIGKVYTEDELNKVIRYFKMGKSNEEIAILLNRTPSGIEKLLSSMGLSRKCYNYYEIEIIRKNVNTHTIDEIVEMLPLRTKKGVIAKCEKLGIKYHSKIK